MVDKIGLFFRQLRRFQQLQKAQDAVHRRADFMTHVGKKPAFRKISRFRLIPGLDDFLFQFAFCQHFRQSIGNDPKQSQLFFRPLIRLFRRLETPQSGDPVVDANWNQQVVDSRIRFHTAYGCITLHQWIFHIP